MSDAIERFFHDTEQARAAAVEYVRRSEKGLPPDRWTNGTEGAALVAEGIRAWIHLCRMNAAALDAYQQQERERGEQAMEASRDPMRDDT